MTKGPEGLKRVGGGGQSQPGAAGQSGVVAGGSSSGQSGPVSRLPSFIKDGLVTAPKDIRLTRGQFTARTEVKVNLVELGQSLDYTARSRSLNEELGTPGVRTKVVDPMPVNSLVQNAKRKDQLRRLQMSSQDPAVRPTFQLPQLRRSLTFTLPKVARSNSLFWTTSHLPTPLPTTGDLRTPWLDPKKMVLKPEPPLPPLKLSELRQHLVSEEGGWTADWVQLQKGLGRGEAGRRAQRKGRRVVKVWQPTIDSVLKNEAMKSYWVRRRTQDDPKR